MSSHIQDDKMLSDYERNMPEYLSKKERRAYRLADPDRTAKEKTRPSPFLINAQFLRSKSFKALKYGRNRLAELIKRDTESKNMLGHCGRCLAGINKRLLAKEYNKNTTKGEYKSLRKFHALAIVSITACIKRDSQEAKELKDLLPLFEQDYGFWNKVMQSYGKVPLGRVLATDVLYDRFDAAHYKEGGPHRIPFDAMMQVGCYVLSPAS